MAEDSHISWTDNTFNHVMGCTKVSPACSHCYAERDMDHRYGKVAWGPQGTRVKTSEANWRKPVKWNREAEESGTRLLVFCASLADVFEDWKGPIVNHRGERLWWDTQQTTPRMFAGIETLENGLGSQSSTRPVTMDDLRVELFRLIDVTPNLDWLLLTKRPENVERMLPSADVFDSESEHKAFWPNVILGTSIENQEWTDKRLRYLHVAKRNGLVSRTFVSAEPLVGPIMLQGDLDGKVYNHLGDGGIDWVITGGESGTNARPCDPEWFRSLRDQCAVTDTPFHFKQWGEFDAEQLRVGRVAAGRILDGLTHDDRPRSLAAHV